MKTRDAGGWIIGGIVLLVCLGQLAQAVLIGRMGFPWIEDEDFLYFFDDPIHFSIQFAFLAAVAGSLGYFGWKEFRKYRERMMDDKPRHTFDARKPGKDG